MKEIDWSNLSFGYMKTDYNVRCYYRDGKWGELELCSEETLNIWSGSIRRLEGLSWKGWKNPCVPSTGKCRASAKYM